MECMVIFVVIVGVVVFAAVISAQKKAKELADCKQAYQNTLQHLKRDPGNPDLREKALRIGRQASNLMRNSQGHTAFDEMSVVNDINAVSAHATVKVEVSNLSAVNPSGVAQGIEKLGQLLIGGVITGEEFERGKVLFLGAPADKAASAVELLQNLDALKKKGVLSESEFNSKKWEILSERFVPGKAHSSILAQKVAKQSPVRVFKKSTRRAQTQAPVEKELVISCPSCHESMSIPQVSVGSRYSCPHCGQTVQFE